MAVWAIADVHLSFGTPDKGMEVFGENWSSHYTQIEKHWRELISEGDLVLIAGDISWAMRQEQVVPDLEWLGNLPGTKVMIRGNHDFWWSSLSKVKKLCPESLHPIQNDSFRWNNYSIGGARLWDTQEYGFGPYIEFRENPVSKVSPPSDAKTRKEQERIFERELKRLELSLQKLDQDAERRIVMTHYPPIGAEMESSRASALLEKYNVDLCVFGHLHNVRPGALPYGKRRAVHYVLSSADYLDFRPIQLDDYLTGQ